MNERQVVTTKKQKSVVSTEDTEKVVMETPAERSLGSSRTRRMRLRAAWMYFIEEMTQNDIAQQLGVGRVTVVRLLTDARERNEVKFSIQGGLQECIAVASELEKRFQSTRLSWFPCLIPRRMPPIPSAPPLVCF
jgi:predicted DNA-binding protein (UPF0251 family)